MRTGLVEYRLKRRAGPVVLVLHGGHMRAGLVLGEDALADHTVLAVSRPGYGRTPASSGTSLEGFADAVRDLCEHLEIPHLAGVVGTSAGGPSALVLAARHPELVGRIILESALGFLPWPDLRTRIGAAIAFAPITQRGTWAVVGKLLRRSPASGLRVMLGSMSTLSAAEVLAELDSSDRTELSELFSRMRSSHGFRNDLRQLAKPIQTVPRQPTLIIATRSDGAVPFAHAQSLLATLPNAELVESRADTHLIWFGRDYPEITDRIHAFLANR
ncbi:alpha/beta hydrolase family protein [Amycolatopsis marina]|uniref:alpha/beta hydrolase family protein n=1 Tax=Amycolatopsis marina TaxID=490629 RepID=UPI000B863271|nr:alpha/beta hydrolase [Amycolatopsis marina]